MRRLHKVTFADGHWMIVGGIDTASAEREAKALRSVCGEDPGEVVRSELLEDFEGMMEGLG